jgi:acyl-CoA synthetase (AMP-forming)/AMP-acid ligase II
MIPDDLATLVDMLAYRARVTPDRVAYTFKDEPCTFASVWQAAGRFGALLRQIGVRPGDGVVMALPNGHDFFTAFYGVLRVGGSAVPLYPASGLERVLSIASMSSARVVVVSSDIPPALRETFRAQRHAAGITMVTADESDGFPESESLPGAAPDDVAFIQYTSGSTGSPKGVQLSHANLLTNISQLIDGMAITPDDIFVSWLPVYHDMGLILKTLVPFALAAELHLLPASLRDVTAWLDAIQRYRATFTAAPDFAYRLCLRYLKNPGAYDLSSLRVALNAAEPVRAQTIVDFHRAFGLSNVMVAGYGLAEATVGVSMWPPQTANRIDKRGFVSVGPPFRGIEIAVVDGERILPPGQVGEIAIKSPANTRGYLNNPMATESLFFRDEYIRSGDLGYLDERGCLYIVGRLKSIIKVAGETISPQEVEEIVDTHPDVRYSAAIGIDRGGVAGEQIFIFAEVRGGETWPEERRYDTALDIVSRVRSRLGHQPGRVYLLREKTIPMTYNGKVQHTALKEQYLQGSLHAGGAILFPDY